MIAAMAQILALLGTAASVVLAFAGTVVLVLLGRTHWARLTALSGASLAALYAALLFLASATSHTTVLPKGATKVFCEIDCHVAFDVPDGARRDGDTVTITVRESFDLASISERRGNGALTPGVRRMVLVDDAGTRYAPTQVQGLSTSPLFSLLRPGESHQALLRFVVPVAARMQGLLIEIDDPVSALLIGHERSPFHGKVLLDLGLPQRS